MNGRSSAPRRRRDEARDLFRAAILAAAEHVFGERGFQAARIQDIAQRAGTAVGTVYNHFDSKEDMLEALLDERIDEIAALLHPAPGDGRSFAARLEARVGRLLGYVEQHRRLFAIMLSYGLGAPAPNPVLPPLGTRARRRMNAFRAALRESVEEGMREGALADLGAQDLAGFLSAAIRSMTWPVLLDDDVELAGKSRLIVRLFLHGASRAKGKS